MALSTIEAYAAPPPDVIDSVIDDLSKFREDCAFIRRQLALKIENGDRVRTRA